MLQPTPTHGSGNAVYGRYTKYFVPGYSIVICSWYSIVVVVVVVVVVAVVLTLTLIIKSVVTGQARVTLEWRNTPGKKTQNQVWYTHNTGRVL